MVVVWAVVDVLVSQLSVPPKVAQTVGPQKNRQRPTKKCGSLNVEMVVVWTVVDVFCGPTVCATTGGADSWSTKTSTTAHTKLRLTQC